MFQVTPGKILDTQELEKTSLASIVKSNKELLISILEKNKNIWNKSEQAEIINKWNSFTGPVRDINHWGILLDYSYDEDTESEIYTVIEYNEFCDPKIEICLASEKELRAFRELFTIIDPVKQIIITERVYLPNSKCSCGSNKKYKKCCMYKFIILMLILISSFCLAQEENIINPRNIPVEAQGSKQIIRVWLEYNTELLNAKYYYTNSEKLYLIGLETWDNQAITESTKLYTLYCKSISKYWKLLIKYKKLIGKLP